jgi:cell wall-associated NlpC family hydrolase
MKRVLIGLLLVAGANAFAVEGQGRVIGNLGQALETSKIYASPNVKSRVFYTAKQYQYLIVSKYSDSYHKVVMSNGQYGYTRASKVVMLPQLVRRSTTSNSSRAAAARRGLNYIGTPYVWGGNDINGGIDCSGFVKKLYGDIGINLPRTAAEQAKVGTPIYRLEDLKPGDRLYFYEKKRNTIGHTGLYLGNGYFVHSSRGHNGVNTDRLTEKWQKILVAARR